MRYLASGIPRLSCDLAHPLPLISSAEGCLARARDTLAYWTHELECAQEELKRWEAERVASLMLIARLGAQLASLYSRLAACSSGPWGWALAAFIWCSIAVTACRLAMAGCQLARVEALVSRANGRVSRAETKKDAAEREVARLEAALAAKEEEIRAKVCGGARGALLH